MGIIIKLTFTFVVISAVLVLLGTASSVTLSPIIIEIVTWLVESTKPLWGILAFREFFAAVQVYLLFLSGYYTFKLTLWVTGLLLGISLTDSVIHNSDSYGATYNPQGELVASRTNHVRGRRTRAFDK